MTNEIACKYIDKDKILPFLDNEMEWALSDDAKKVYSENYLIGYYDAIGNIQNDIIRGMFDWQQGSE